MGVTVEFSLLELTLRWAEGDVRGDECKFGDTLDNLAMILMISYFD